MTADSIAASRVKRTACWIQTPTIYEVSCDLCGGNNITWSEWEHMIWCYDCEQDTPGNKGIFDGPIPTQVCAILGISFDKIDIATDDRLYIHNDGKRIWWDKIPHGED